jgi:hypothetical protein
MRCLDCGQRVAANKGRNPGKTGQHFGDGLVHHTRARRARPALLMLFTAARAAQALRQGAAAWRALPVACRRAHRRRHRRRWSGGPCCAPNAQSGSGVRAAGRPRRARQTPVYVRRARAAPLVFCAAAGTGDDEVAPACLPCAAMCACEGRSCSSPPPAPAQARRQARSLVRAPTRRHGKRRTHTRGRARERLGGLGAPTRSPCAHEGGPARRCSCSSPTRFHLSPRYACSTS